MGKWRGRHLRQVHGPSTVLPHSLLPPMPRIRYSGNQPLQQFHEFMISICFAVAVAVAVVQWRVSLS